MTTFRVDFVRGKDRPRFTGTGRTYTTKRTHDDEQAIRAAYLDVIAKEGNVIPAEHQTGRVHSNCRRVPCTPKVAPEEGPLRGGHLQARLGQHRKVGVRRVERSGLGG